MEAAERAIAIDPDDFRGFIVRRRIHKAGETTSRRRPTAMLRPGSNSTSPET